MNKNFAGAVVLGISLLLGLVGLGFVGSRGAIRVKELERTVTVKGLSEREYPADIVIWPVLFTAADNDLTNLYGTVEQNVATITAFLGDRGVTEEEVSISPPSVVDKSAFAYGGGVPAEFRYVATQTITVYSEEVEKIRAAIGDLAELGKSGIVFQTDDYRATTSYLFNRLNEVKPEMVEEATTKAREVAEKFAQDSDSRLGKIKKASQGQFSISDRDANNPHVKTVRVVSTIEYYLAD